MKKVIAAVIVSVFVMAVVAQDAAQTKIQTKQAEVSQLMLKIQEDVGGQLDVLPAAVKAQLQTAKQAAVQAQTTLKKMNADGKSAAEMEAVMKQTRDEAQVKLAEAIQAMDQVSAKVQAQVNQAKDDVQKRLAAKEAEMKQIMDQTKTGTPGGKN
jgi:hypothetical protein